MAKIRQFGSVRHTGGSGDGEERVVESIRQHVRDNDDRECAQKTKRSTKKRDFSMMLIV